MPQTKAVVGPPSVDESTLKLWCEDHLGSAPVQEVFASAHLSRVIGLRLANGMAVVVKVRAPAERLQGCYEVHRHLFAAGFPCPEPIVEPTPIGEHSATAERYIPGGTPLPRSGRAAEPFATALAELIGAAPPPGSVGALDPPPPWTACAWTGAHLWPPADDLDVDLNEVDGPVWVDEAAAAAQKAVAACGSTRLIGHGDWYTANLSWNGDQLLAVHDWDSVIAAPEPVVVGLAAAGFAATGKLGEEVTVDETERFIAAYETIARRIFTESEMACAWAAGLWLRVFDAKKEFAQSGATYTCNESEAAARLRRVG